MGDVAMTVPVITALVQQFENVEVTVVSRPLFRPFFEDLPRVHFFAVDVQGRHKGFSGLWRLYRELSKLKPDGFADFHNVLRSKIVRIFFCVSGTRTAYTDKGRAEKKALTRAENKVFKPLKTMVQRHCDTLSALGFQVQLNNIILPQPRILSAKIRNITGAKIKKWIGIAPFAQYKTKVYPEDLMREVILKLALDDHYQLFLLGGGTKETELLNQMQQKLDNVVVVAGKLNLEEEMALISNFDLMLSMDSGNAHIAAMLGVKVLTLWGNTHPYAGFLPFNQSFDNTLTADRNRYPKIPTSVYGNKQVEGYEEAMRTISADEVVEKIKYLSK